MKQGPKTEALTNDTFHCKSCIKTKGFKRMTDHTRRIHKGASTLMYLCKKDLCQGCQAYKRCKFADKNLMPSAKNKVCKKSTEDEAVLKKSAKAQIKTFTLSLL